MKKPKPFENGNPLKQHVQHYAGLSKTPVLKHLSSPQLLLLMAAFLSGLPAAEATVIYSGVRNVAANIPNHNNLVEIDLNSAGIKDFKIANNLEANSGIRFIRIDKVGGADFAINGFIAVSDGVNNYPIANNSGFVIGSDGPWNFAASQANILADDAASEDEFPHTMWEMNGMTRYLGFRAILNGSTKYGWIRLTRNNHAQWNIVDWAYEDNGSSIIAGATLPVELFGFHASQNAQTVRLQWRTATEHNNAGFDVERCEDGVSFRSIGWVAGHGTTTQQQQYLYADQNLHAGTTYYYRLRQVDYNGTFELGPIITIMVKGKSSIVGAFYPNPAPAGQVSLDFTTEEAADWLISVFDAAGKPVRFQGGSHISVAEGQTTILVDFSGLPNGMYIVTLENGAERVYRKVVIE